jgi:5-methylcytosine-specific restriction endonuclease McrA
MRAEMIAAATHCGICGGGLKKNAHYLDPLAPQLDYIMPVSRGGSHGRENSQIVHRYCNQSKWNKIFYEDVAERPVYFTDDEP